MNSSFLERPLTRPRSDMQAGQSNPRNWIILMYDEASAPA